MVWKEGVLAPTACLAIVAPKVAGGPGASAVEADGRCSRTYGICSSSAQPELKH